MPRVLRKKSLVHSPYARLTSKFRFLGITAKFLCFLFSTSAGEEIAPATATATSVAQVHPPLEPICDLSDRRYDGCEMWGDARTASGANNSVVYFIPPPPQLANAAAAT